MYKNNGSFMPEIDKNIKSTKKMKRRPNRNIIKNSKLKRALCFLAGCIHILIFVLIYVFGIKHLYMRNYIDEIVELMVFGVGFLLAGIFCFRHFALYDKDKANVITVNIGILFVAFAVSSLVLTIIDAWENRSTVDHDIFAVVFGCIIAIGFGVLIIKGGLKGGKPKEVLESLDNNNPVNNEKKRNIKNYIEHLDDIDMISFYDEDDMDDADVYKNDEDKERKKPNNMRETIYKTLLKNKPNENNFR